MAPGAWYREGTVSVTNGSVNITGTDTLWNTQVSVGDLFTLDASQFYEVQTVTSNTAIVLKSSYLGSTASAQSYMIIRNFTSSLNAALAANLADLLNRWHTREDEWYDWHQGTADGVVTDPAGQPEAGYYPFTNAVGGTEWIACPAKMATMESTAATSFQIDDDNSGPMWKHDGSGGFQARNAADNADAPVKASSATLSGLTASLPVFSSASKALETKTAADAFTAIKQAATTSATGVVMLATRSKTLGGTDTSSPVVPVDLAAAEAILSNPKLYSQGLSINYSSSGRSILIPDNDNLDFGTGNFFIYWQGVLNVGLGTTIVNKTSGTTPNIYGYKLDISSSAVVSLTLYRNDAGTTYTASAALTDRFAYSILIVITRETATTAGSVAFYVDGLLLGSTQTITAAAPVTVSNSGNLYLSGTATTRTRMFHSGFAVGNCALTAAEVLAIYRMGFPASYKAGNATIAYTADFSAGVDGWDDTYSDKTGGVDGVSDGTTSYDNCIEVVASGTSYVDMYKVVATTYNKYQIDFDVYVPAANVTGKKIAVLQVNGLYNYFTVGTAWTHVTSVSLDMFADRVFPCILLVTTADAVFGITVGDKFYVTNLTVKLVGATVCLDPEGIQPAPGQWLDSSSNKLHALQPVGASVLSRRKKDFEIRWTNTWAGTHEAQYIGGVDQSILPPNCYIDSIIGVVSGATIEDIIIGDGSDTDRWVVLTTGLAAGTVSFTLANRVSDGTNYKLVVDPDANFTGSIAWTIKGIILQ